MISEKNSEFFDTPAPLQLIDKVYSLLDFGVNSRSTRPHFRVSDLYNKISGSFRYISGYGAIEMFVG